MKANVNAAGILGVVLLTCILLRWKGERRTTVWRVVGGVLAALIVSFCGGILTAHACNQGTPVFQWAIPAVCIILLAAFLKSDPLRQSVFAVSLAAFLLSVHFVHIVHRGYTGNPHHTNGMGAMISAHHLQRVQRTFAELPTDGSAAYPAGWLDESPAMKGLSKSEREWLDDNAEYHEMRAFHLWHTWFTGLYDVRSPRTLRLWYPGGPLEEGIAGLTWREKPRTEQPVTAKAGKE